MKQILVGILAILSIAVFFKIIGSLSLPLLLICLGILYTCGLAYLIGCILIGVPK